MNNLESLKSFYSSELLLILGIVVLIFVSLRQNSQRTSLAVTFVTLVLSLFATISTPMTKAGDLFYGMIALDPFGQFFKVLVLGSALVTIVLVSQSKELEKTPKPEFYAFLLTLTLGLNTMVVSNDLLMMYLAIEMASIVSYVMAGYLSDSRRSEEAGLKYVLYGGVASAVMIFGMSLLYGLSGSLNLVEIRSYFMENATDRLVLFITFIMILTGLGYKMAIAPFHMWSPDVYEGAPLPVTAFLSIASKAAGFAITLRFFVVGFVVIDSDGAWSVLKALDWQTLVAVLAAVTMTVGNFVALYQTNIKRFLAYSSVAHAGYMLMGVAVQSVSGIESVMFYFMVYFLMNLGSFFVAALILNQFGTEEMTDYKGLAKQNAFGLFLSLALAVFLFSLAGIPPFAGFIGKWYVFKAVVDSGLIWLGVIGALNSVVSLFYYVRLVKYMLIDDATKEMKPAHTHWRFTSVIAVFAFFTLCFGIYFGPLVQWAKASAVMFY